IGSSKITWNEHNIIDITNWLTRVLKNDRPLKYNFEQKNKLYFFRKGQTFPMIRLYFKTFAALKHCKNIVNKPCNIPAIGPINFKILEDTISPIRKCFSEKNLAYCQWFRIQGREVLDNNERVSVAGSLKR